MYYYWGHSNCRTFLAMKVVVDKLKFVMSITQVILCSYLKRRRDFLKDRLGKKSFFWEVYRDGTPLRWVKKINVLFQYKYVKYFCVSNRSVFLLKYGVLSNWFTIILFAQDEWSYTSILFVFYLLYWWLYQ